jgi:hypothetical protein
MLSLLSKRIPGPHLPVLENKVSLLLVMLKKEYLAESFTQNMTLPKSFPRPQSSPSDGFVSLVHVLDFTNQGPFEEDGLMTVRHLLSEVGSTMRRPATKKSRHFS